MKNTKKLFLSLSAMVCVLGLAACGGTSTALPPSTSGNTSTPSTSTPAPAENTFGEGITDDEKAFFPGLISGTGDFTKNTDFTATGSLTDRFDVKVGGTLKYIIYKGAKANGFGINITAYIGVDVSTLKISGFKTVGDVHSNDTNADISSLPLVGTDGNITVESGSMGGATVSANTLVDIAKEAVAQAKVDAGSSTAENTFGDGITAEEKEIFPSLIKGTGDFTKNTDFTATGSLTDRFDVKVSDTLKYIIYKGSKANGFGVNITAYIGVDVSTFQISGFKTVGDVHSEGSNFDISSLPLAGTDGNITVESGSMGGATVSANTLVAIAKEAVAQAKVDTEEPTEETDDVEVLTSLAGTGTYTKDTSFTATDILTSRYVVTENGFVTKVIYKGHKLNSDRFKVDVTAYIAVDALTLKITGFETVGTLHSANPDADVSALPLPGTDGNITVNDGDFGGGRTGASVSARAVVEIAKAAVAQATLDFPPLTSEETTALSTLISGEYTRHILANVTYDSTYVSNGKILVTDCFYANEGNVVVYRTTMDKGWGTYLTTFVGVDVDTLKVTGVELTGTRWSPNWTPVDVENPDQALDDFADKFVNTDGNITDTITGLTQSTSVYKELVQAAVKQAKVDFPVLTTEESAALETLAGSGTIMRQVGFTSDNELVARYDVTEGDAVTKVIYKGEVSLPQGYTFTAYVAVDVNTHLITGYELLGEPVSSRWEEKGFAESFEGWEDKFVGTDGSTDLENVVQATLTSNAFKNIAKAAVAQAIIDFAPALSEEEKTALQTLAGTGTYELNATFTAANTLTARYDVTESGVVTKVIYKGEVLLKQGYYFTAYVAVDVNTKLITGYEVIGDVVSSAWTDHASSFEGWEDKFVGTNGSTVTDTVAGATLTSNAFKNIAKDAVAQASLDFEPALSEEEKTALQTLAGTGTYEYNGTFTGTDTLTARYDVTEGDAVTKVIYKGEVSLPQGYTFTAYVAVDVNTHLITGYELLGEPVSSRWEEKGYASQFEGWEDKFVGTDGSTDIENVVQATLTSNAFKNIAKAAVAQAVIDFE